MSFRHVLTGITAIVAAATAFAVLPSSVGATQNSHASGSAAPAHSTVGKVRTLPMQHKRASAILPVRRHAVALLAARKMHKEFCAYSAHTIGQLEEFQAMVGGPVTCALMFNDQSKNWDVWSSPWFLHSPNDKNYAWPAWVKGESGRRLIITTGLVPVTGMPQDWLHRAATGDYTKYAVTLAKNLVAAGLGNSVIRLSHEANGKWNFDRVPDSAQGRKDWRAAWGKVVTAMRSVAGGTFTFDWTVNYQVRYDLGLNDFYPGDEFVDVVGLDAYDENTKNMTGRFAFQQTRRGGINEIVAFAKAHGKQLSFPEWGILPVSSSMEGGGDQPTYVDGIAATVAANDFAYTSYWYAHADTQTLLKNSPMSLAALRRGFGAGGTAR